MDCEQSLEFSVKVIADNVNSFCHNGAKYAAMKNLTTYSLRLMNNDYEAADVVVRIDGQEVGKWRVNGMSSITIDRPADNKRKFTFVSETSSIARRTGNRVGKEENGLVEAIFYPEKQKPVYRPVRRSRSPSPERRSSMSSLNFRESESASYSSGVTVLGERSDQDFDYISPITNINRHKITTIMVRLVIDEPDYVNIKEKRNGIYPRRLDR